VDILVLVLDCWLSGLGFLRRGNYVVIVVLVVLVVRINLFGPLVGKL
jgi:hypothetical protein